MTRRVLVTGSRTWVNEDTIHTALHRELREHGFLVLVHGACPLGADLIADRWARGRAQVRVERHPANWGKGRSAGPERNRRMVKRGADICLAFIQARSRGATQCAEAAQKAGIPVVIMRED